MFFDYLPEEGLVCAHRGTRSIAPENTLLAMRKARECGAHFWETDVRMSRDGSLILFHDATLDRTTDILTNRLIHGHQHHSTNQFTVGELRQLDAGSWFLADDPFGTVSGGEVKEEPQIIRSQKIPLLQEALEWSGKYRFPVNLEIKDLETPAGDVEIVDKIMAMLRQTGTMDLVLLSSFRHEYLFRARSLNPAIGLAVLVEGQHPPHLIKYLDTLNAIAYHPEESLCDAELTNDLLRAGYHINTWTVNDCQRARKLMAKGIGIITDWPQRLL